MRVHELRQKEVINIADGCRFGYIVDVIIEKKEGKCTHIIIPGPGRVFGVFGRDQEFKIPWGKIKQIGDDIVLVEVESDKVLVDCE